MTFDDTLARLARIPAATLLERRWTWPEKGREVDARYILDRAVEQEHEAAVAASASWQPTEAARILRLAQMAFGDLRGVLAALTDDLLDVAPEPGEWTIRETCEHALRVERTYRAAVRWANDRRDDQPVQLPEEKRAAPEPADTAGRALDIAHSFVRRRAETDAELAGIDAGALTRPSVWSGVDVDVRFRLHRFASHLQEHTIQIEKALDSLEWHPGDAPRAVRRLSVARSLHERISPPDVLAELDADHAAKAQSLGA